MLTCVLPENLTEAPSSRRPEITIVAAEPLRPASWFPGAPPPGLGFPSTPVGGSWRPNDLVPAEVGKHHIISLHSLFLQIAFRDLRSEAVSALPVTAQRCKPFSFFAFQLPPSYEQVIKEINQVQVNSTNNNNAAATPRSTITSATQTDFPEEIDGDPPPSNTGDLSSLVLT